MRSALSLDPCACDGGRGMIYGAQAGTVAAVAAVATVVTALLWLLLVLVGAADMAARRMGTSDTGRAARVSLILFDLCFHSSNPSPCCSSVRVD